MRVVLLPVLFFSLCSFAQEAHFKPNDQKLLVTKGQLIRIDADTAYLISQSRAELLNSKLKELQQVRISYEDLGLINQQLLDKVKEVETLVSRLIESSLEDSTNISTNFESIADHLDRSLITLKENNDQLAQNNHALEQQIDLMERTIKALRKDIRGIWWNGIADKVVVGFTGLLVGIAIASLRTLEHFVISSIGS